MSVFNNSAISAINTTTSHRVVEMEDMGNNGVAEVFPRDDSSGQASPSNHNNEFIIVAIPKFPNVESILLYLIQ